MKSIDRAALIPLAIILIVVVGTWLGVLGPVVDDSRARGLYEVLKDWQTLVAAIIALVAAVVAVRPVWQQLAEMRVQSTIQTHEMLRQRLLIVEEDRRLAYEAKLQAMHSTIVEGWIAKDALATSDRLPRLVQECEERIRDLANLKQSLDLTETRRWGSREAQTARHNLVMRLLELRKAVFVMMTDLKIALSRTPAGTPASSQWIAEKKRIRGLTVAQQASALLSAVDDFVRHADLERMALQTNVQRMLVRVVDAGRSDERDRAA
jgi:hypothetical protein